MFSNAVKLFDIFGFQIKVDPSWLIIAALIVWSLSSGYFPQEVPGLHGSDYLALAVVAMLGLFACLILHELAHSVVARRVGPQEPDASPAGVVVDRQDGRIRLRVRIPANSRAHIAPPCSDPSSVRVRAEGEAQVALPVGDAAGRALFEAGPGQHELEWADKI